MQRPKNYVETNTFLLLIVYLFSIRNRLHIALLLFLLGDATDKNLHCTVSNRIAAKFGTIVLQVNTQSRFLI